MPATSPVLLVRQALSDYDSVDEMELSRREHALLQQYGFSAEPERSLLYALRVSKAGVNAKTLPTMVSRWGVTNSGAGGFGLAGGSDSPIHGECCSFLAKRFLSQLSVLLEQIWNTASEKEAYRSGAAAKINIYKKAIERLQVDIAPLAPVLPGSKETIDATMQRLHARLDELSRP